jgi:hypothetical protein
LFTFRYHAISLIAVFLALGIGVLLGVSIGEEGVVSGARKDLENSLRGDLSSARGRVSDLRGELVVRDQFESQSYPGLVAGLLPGFRIGVVAMGDLPGGYGELIRDAVEPAGADIASISVIRAPLRLDKLAAELKRTSFKDVDQNSDTLSKFGERIGKQLGNGGGLVDRVKGDLFSSSRGEYRGLDGIVFVRDRDGLKGQDRQNQDRFETALLSGIRSTDSEVVGVEKRDTDPSQIPFMIRQRLPSVDDLDLVAGQTALVYVLLGADGQFGVKGTAAKLLPPPALDRPSNR